MRRISLSLFLLLISVIGAEAQTRPEAVKIFQGLKEKQADTVLQQILLSPSGEDLRAAANNGVGVFRLLPRETYDSGILPVRGGGAYFSFYYRFPDYGHGSDLELQNNSFSVGFAGPDYGLIKDIGEVSLEIVEGNSAVPPLIDYAAKREISDARREYQALSKALVVADVSFSKNTPAVIGHTYIVRSINYDYSDVLAAFKVGRRDEDGSLIIFWKLIRQFDTPKFASAPKETATDSKILQQIKQSFARDIFSGIKADVSAGVVTLRGTIAKKEVAYAVELADHAGATKVVNLLSVD